MSSNISFSSSRQNHQIYSLPRLYNKSENKKWKSEVRYDKFAGFLVHPMIQLISVILIVLLPFQVNDAHHLCLLDRESLEVHGQLSKLIIFSP